MYSIDNMPNQIDIGFTGEKAFRKVEIDMTKWMQKMPNGYPSIVHIRPGEKQSDAYIAVTTFANNILTWTISDADLGPKEGIGSAQIWLEETQNSSVQKRGKSIKVATQVHGSINDASATPPTGQEAFLEQVNTLKNAAVAAAQSAYEYKEDALDAKDAAESAVNDAVSAKDDAVDAKTDAESAQGNAEAAQSAAEAAQGLAEAAQTAAEGAQEAAETAQGLAESAQAAAEDAQEAAEAAQDAAEEAQAAAEAAVEKYPYVDEEDGYWYVWDSDDSEYVSTGVKAQGEQGDPGQDGDDGYSPTATVTKSGSTATISITDKNGTTSTTISDGTNGTDGISPTASVSKVGDTATISITDTNGTTTATISDGTDGTDGTDGVDATPALITVDYSDLTFPVSAGTPCYHGGNLYVANQNISTSEEWTAAHWTQTTVEEQLNSIKSAINSKQDAPASAGSEGNFFGLALVDGQLVPVWSELPLMGNSSSQKGIAYVDSSYGIQAQSSHRLVLFKALSADIQTGTHSYRPIVPYNQHESTFFGLAKAASADMASLSSVTVGQYPEAQKSAISDMLNAPVSVSGSTPSINAKSGVRYVCGEVATLTIVAPASGIIDVSFESGSTPTVLTVTPPTGMTMRWIGDDPTALEANKHYEINIADGCNGMVVSWT